MQRSFRIVMLVAAAAWATVSAAQNYPVRPVKIITGFLAGSTVDVMVPPLAQHLTGTLGQQFIGDNRVLGSNYIADWLADNL